MKTQTRLAKAPRNTEREWVHFHHCHGLVALKLVEWFDEDQLSRDEEPPVAQEPFLFIGWLMDMDHSSADDGYASTSKHYYVTDRFDGHDTWLSLPCPPHALLGEDDIDFVIWDNKRWRLISYAEIARLVIYPNYCKAALKHKWVIDPLEVSLISQYGEELGVDVTLLREILKDLMLYNICEAEEISD